MATQTYVQEMQTIGGSSVQQVQQVSMQGFNTLRQKQHFWIHFIEEKKTGFDIASQLCVKDTFMNWSNDPPKWDTFFFFFF